MFANRLLNLFVVISLVAVAALLVREASATAAVVSNVDSGTRSYIGWAKAVELESNQQLTHTSAGRGLWNVAGILLENKVDSATRSYVSWAKDMQCR